jgi:hypothetical protein
MSRRLQVLLDEAEYREIRKLARQRHATVAAWVRDALRAARQRQPSGDAERKLRALRAAADHAYPTADIGEMLAEIERGYGGGQAP